DDGQVYASNLRLGRDEVHPRCDFQHVEQITVVSGNEHAERNVVEQMRVKARSGLRVAQRLQAGNKLLSVAQLSTTGVALSARAVTQCFVRDAQEGREVDCGLLNENGVDHA